MGIPELRNDFNFRDVLLVNFVNITDKEKEMIRVWRNTEDVKKWMYSDHIISPDEHSEFMEGIKEDYKNFYWLAKRNDGEYLGVISLNKADRQAQSAYLGIYSNPYCELKGAGYVLIECLKKAAFDIAGLHDLKLEAIEGNERALNFYKKAGFTEEGRLRDFILKHGKRHDVIVMGIANQ